MHVSIYHPSLSLSQCVDLGPYNNISRFKTNNYLVTALQERGTMEYTIVIAKSVDSLATLQYLNSS